MRRYILLVLLLCVPMLSPAGQDNVYQRSSHKPMSEVYDWVYKELEQQGFYVVFEANIGNNLAGFADNWGTDYNQSKLDGIRSMVFCNSWYANQISNLDPTMLALCPLHLTLIEKAGTTTVLFARPTVVAQNSPAYKVLLEVEQKIINAIKVALPAS